MSNDLSFIAGIIYHGGVAWTAFLFNRRAKYQYFMSSDVERPQVQSLDLIQCFK
jgi:hypothetical protein